MNFPILLFWCYIFQKILYQTLQTSIQIKELRPNEIRYYSGIYDSYNDDALRALAFGANKYSISVWVNFKTLPSVGNKNILTHLTLLNDSAIPSDYSNIPSSYQHLSLMMYVDVETSVTGTTIKGYISYIGTPSQLVFTSFIGITTGTWYFIYAGVDQINKAYTIGFSTYSNQLFQTTTPVTGLTTDGNEQLDNRLVIYFGGSKGVANSLLFNGYMTSPVFYINYYTSSNPQYLMFGEAKKVCYFNLNVASTSYIYDAWGSYSEISFGATTNTLQNDDPLFTGALGLQFSTTSNNFLTISNQYTFSDFTFVSFWIYIGTVTSADLAIFSVLNTINNVVFEFYYDGANAEFKTKCLSTSTASGIPIVANVWNHVVVIFSKSLVFSQIYFNIFLNGVNQNSQFPSNLIPVSPPDLTLPTVFYFGKISTDSTFSGNIMNLYTGRGARIMISPSSILYCQMSIGIQQPYCLYCTTIAYLYNGTCVLSCPVGTYTDQNTRTCQNCNVLCNTCIGPLESDCLSCSNPYLYLFNSRCFEYCPLGTVVSTNYTCICDPSCQTCAFDTTSQKVLCQSCVNPSHFIRDGYQCVESLFCYYNYFGNTAVSSTCTSTCSGTYKNFAVRECTSYCTTGSLKYENSGDLSCLKQCPPTYHNSTITAISGFQVDQTVFQCSTCSSPCLTCDQNICLSCISGYFYHENNGTCNTSCLDGFVLDGKVCRVCRSNCSICPNNFYLYNSSCVVTCPLATTQVNMTCVASKIPLVIITNKTTSNILSITRQKDLFLVVYYLYLYDSIDSISWSLGGISSVYINDFFSSTYSTLKTLTIPKSNLRGNVLYNVTVTVYAKGIKGQDFILIQTYPDIDLGIFLINPTVGVSGVDNFTMSLLLWNNYQNLSFSVYSFNKVIVILSQNKTIYSRYDPDVIFTNLTSNGNYSFITRPLKEASNISIELVVSNFDTQYRKNITISLLPYNGNLTSLQLDIWRVNYSSLNTLYDIYETAYSLYLIYATPFSLLYQKNLAFEIYKTAKLLNKNPSYFCDDLVHCSGNGVCQNNPLNSKSFYCRCFQGYSGENCGYYTRDFQLLTNYTLNLILNMKNIDLNTIDPLAFVKCLKVLLEMQDLLSKNGVILSILHLQNILSLSTLSIESLSVIIVDLGLINFHIYKRPSFRLDEQIKYSKMIMNLLDLCLNITESLITLGQDYFISSEYVDIFLSKKPRFSFLSSELVFNGSLIIPLSKVQIYIPVEAFAIEDIITLRIIQWKSSFQDFNTSDLDISLKGQIEFKIAGNKTQITKLNNPAFIYLAKITSYDPIYVPGQQNLKTPYTCGYFNETSNTFNSDGCLFVNETNQFILCNCSHFTTFSAQIIPSNITNPPSLSTLLDENNLDSTVVSIYSLLNVDFSQNLMASRYIPIIKKQINNDIIWENPGLYAAIPLFFVYLLSCLLNSKNWKKNRFEQIMNENKPILILTYHPFISLSIKAHSDISHTQQMRLTKLFLTYFSDLFCSALLFTELININSQITLTNRMVGAILIGLILSYVFHFLIEWLYKGIILEFCFGGHQNSLIYHLICWSSMSLFIILTIYEMGKTKENDQIYWLYVIIIMFVSEIVIIYSFFLIYPFWTSNKGYFVPSLQYMGFYINYDEDTFQIPLDDKSEDRKLYNPETMFNQQSS